MKKILMLAFSAFALNLFALDVYGLWELSTDDTTYVNENLHVHPGGVIQPYNGHRVLVVNGSIINEGIIRNHESTGYQLTVDCTGGITNYGHITNLTVKLKGSAVHILHTTPSTPFNPNYFSVENSIPILPTSDVYFENSIITFPNGGGFDLRDGFGLILTGGYLDGAVITGDAAQFPKPYLQMQNGAVINNSVCQDLSYWETILVEENVVFEGVSDNRAVIKPYSNAHRTITVKDDFTNAGSFENNNPYHLYAVSSGMLKNTGTFLNEEVQILDTLVNAGTMTPYFIRFNGTQQQHITASFAYPIAATNTSCSNLFGIIATSDLYFENSLINFTDNPIEISNGYGLYVYGGYMNRMNITGKGIVPESVSHFNMSGGCYMQNTKLTNLILSGTVEMADDNCSLEGKVLNQGTLQNRTGWFYTLTVNGDFENLGSVTNNPVGYNLTLNFNGSKLTNNGTWNNYYTNITDSTDQHIVLGYGKTIASPEVYFKTALTTAPHAWYYNNSQIQTTNTDFSYADTQNLRWNIPVSETYFGSFYCQTGEGPSRKVFINDGTFASPVITGSGYENGVSSIYWENIPSAASYKIYSSHDPYADPATWTFETEVFTNECSITGQTENKKFYFVKAVY